MGWFTLPDITINVICVMMVDKNDFEFLVTFNDTDAMELGKVIKKLREARGWSQDELAFRTGTSAANISRIENGKHGAGEELLEALSREFDYKVYQLVALAEGVEAPIIPVNSNPDAESLLFDYNLMTVEQRILFRAIGSEFVRVANLRHEEVAGS